jgi:hypothetical protein
MVSSPPYATAPRRFDARRTTSIIDQAARSLPLANGSSRGARARKSWRTFRSTAAAPAGARSRPAPRAIRNKTYPLPEILEALTLYDRGNTLAATAAKISSRFGHRVAPSTISRWLAEHTALHPELIGVAGGIPDAKHVHRVSLFINGIDDPQFRSNANLIQECLVRSAGNEEEVHVCSALASRTSKMYASRASCSFQKSAA